MDSFYSNVIEMAQSFYQAERFNSCLSAGPRLKQSKVALTVETATKSVGDQTVKTIVNQSFYSATMGGNSNPTVQMSHVTSIR